MLAIQKIKQEISMLPKEELFLFRDWFNNFDAKMWDTQIEEDVKTGKLDKYADQAIKDFRAGKCKKL